MSFICSEMTYGKIFLELIFLETEVTPVIPLILLINLLEDCSVIFLLRVLRNLPSYYDPSEKIDRGFAMTMVNCLRTPRHTHLGSNPVSLSSL